MDYLSSFTVLFLLLFAFLSGAQDLRERKVSNKITFLLFSFSLLFFLFSLFFGSLDLLSVLVLVLSSLLSYLLYAYDYWGAADGKIFLSLSLLVLALGGSFAWASFVLTLLFSYSLALIASVFLFTQKKQWMKVLKTISFLNEFLLFAFFYTLFACVFSFLSYSSLTYPLFFSFLLLFFSSALLGKRIKALFSSVPFFLRLFVSLLFLVLFYFFTKEFFLLFSFLFVYMIRILILWISSLSAFMHYKGETYYTPFSLYLFFSALLTLLLFKGILNF